MKANNFKIPKLKPEYFENLVNGSHLWLAGSTH